MEQVGPGGLVGEEKERRQIQRMETYLWKMEKMVMGEGVVVEIILVQGEMGETEQLFLPGENSTPFPIPL
jgi:hypothetical protein